MSGGGRAGKGERAGAPPRQAHRPPSTRPEKMCVVCARPFQWRKRWARVWDEVKYCSDLCRRRRG